MPRPSDLLDAVQARGLPIPHAGRSRHAARRIAGVALLVLGALGVAATPATAWSSSYSISIVEGVTTLPEDSILATSASAPGHTSVTLRILRAGEVVAQNTGEGGAWLSQVPQVGEAVTLEAPSGSGQIVGSVVYDGLPTMEPTVCAGSTNFSGQRTTGTEVEGSFFTLLPHTSYVASRLGGTAQITSLTGSTFGGNFLKAPAFGQTLSALERERTPLPGGQTFTYESETQRPVGACPVPSPPAPPPPPPPALSGSILKLVRTTLLKLLRFGLTDQVAINQPGTVTQDLYLQNGKIPATAAAVEHRGRRHKHRPAALLLAQGSATATTAGTVSVELKLTSAGRRRLAHARTAHVVLVTALHSTSGAKLSLGRRSITLHR